MIKIDFAWRGLYGGLYNSLLPRTMIWRERGDDDHSHDDEIDCDDDVDVDDDVHDHLAERATTPDQIVFVVQPDVFY